MALEDANKAIETFIQRAELFAGIMAANGVPVRFHSYWRGEIEQNQAYERGSSKARYGESSHNFGLGADYHFDQYGWNVPKEWWAYGDKVAKYVGLTSGIDYGDANHIELPGWKKWRVHFLTGDRF